MDKEVTVMPADAGELVAGPARMAATIANMLNSDERVRIDIRITAKKLPPAKKRAA